MLDHDLHQQIATAEEAKLSGSHLIDRIIKNVDNEVPILGHSMNAVRNVSMTLKHLVSLV
jgi:hypothetical protein